MYNVCVSVAANNHLIHSSLFPTATKKWTGLYIYIFTWPDVCLSIQCTRDNSRNKRHTPLLRQVHVKWQFFYFLDFEKGDYSKNCVKNWELLCNIHLNCYATTAWDIQGVSKRIMYVEVYHCDQLMINIFPSILNNHQKYLISIKMPFLSSKLLFFFISQILNLGNKKISKYEWLTPNT